MNTCKTVLVVFCLCCNASCNVARRQEDEHREHWSSGQLELKMCRSRVAHKHSLRLNSTTRAHVVPKSMPMTVPSFSSFFSSASAALSPGAASSASKTSASTANRTGVSTRSEKADVHDTGAVEACGVPSQPRRAMGSNVRDRLPESPSERERIARRSTCCCTNSINNLSGLLDL